MRLFFFIALLLISITATAQDLNGIWRGTLTQEKGGCFTIYNLEIQISQKGNILSGNAFDYYDQSRYVKHHYNGRYNSHTKRMVLIEDKVMEVNIPFDCVACTKTYDLSWSLINGKEALTGEWKGFDIEQHRSCPPGKITLYRVATTEFPVDIDQPQELANLQQNVRLQERETEVVTTLAVETSNLKIDLYDNAEIDNDTITVFLNNKLLLYKQRLNNKPLTLELKAFPGTDYELVMYADNLGSIPPNTALMVVTAGKEKYEVRLSASDKKNAAVRFRLKEK